MTSDLETTTDDLYETIRELWQEAQPGMTDNDASGFGQSVVSIQDTAIAERTGLELAAVRDFLDNADGVKFEVGRDGETRTVKALIDL
ncbi:hypothetical protein [Nocardioides sp. SYSU D00065]|uniref:hypothetical protein n=1 Tax=Nocardioides sp. SYSU D00065 TaxID=2817378 RepID=UPI001B31B286|nr:hypothetical protein [Nocardioides sp. SYSU D00065]